TPSAQGMHPMLLLYAPPPRGRAHISTVFLSLLLAACPHSPPTKRAQCPQRPGAALSGGLMFIETARSASGGDREDEIRRWDSRLGCPLASGRPASRR